MAQRVYFFGNGQADGDPQRPDILGGKGASLAAMSRCGLPVPPGFTIAAECCRLFLESGGKWPEGLQEEVRANLARLQQATGRTFGDGRRPLLVAVRSGAAVSMPGMMDTILNCGLSSAMAQGQPDPAAFWRVYGQFILAFARTSAGIPAADFQAAQRQVRQRRGRKDAPLTSDDLRELAERYRKLHADRAGKPFPDDPWEGLVQCIELVFASWNNDRAVAYRREHDIRGLAGTAVNVQSMFPAQVSGVVFTTNPNNPAAEEMIVESSYGLGEALVSGDVHPDHFAVDRRSLAVTGRAIGRKTRAVLALGDSRPRDPDAPSLTEQQLGELARMALNVEKFFGRPVDLEWGMADGAFALLQSRPITTIEQAEAYEELLQSTRQHLRQLAQAGRGPWVLHNLAETLPHPTPLTWSVIRPFMSGRGGFGAMYVAAGFAPSPTACDEGFLELIAGKVYMDAGRVGEMFFENYPFAYDLDLLRSDPDAAQSPPTVPRGSLLARGRAMRRAGAVNRRLRRLAEDLDGRLNERIIPDFVAWCRQEKQRDLGALSQAQLIESWRQRQRRVLDEFAPQSLLPSLVSAMALEELRTFLAENFWSEAGEEDIDELAGSLSVPAAPDKTVLANAELYAVASGRGSLRQWLADHGHRATDEFDLAAPRWRERPEEVQGLSERLKDGADPMDLLRRHVAKTQARIESLRARLGRRARAEFDRRLALARRYILFREDGKHYLMVGYDLLRDLALEAGRRLGLGDDVFMLTVEELFDALREGPVPRQLLGRRRAAYRAEARAALPHVIDSAAIDSLGEPPKLQSWGSYPAFALSTGTASGPAWVVRSPQEAGKARRGYILVCSSTDPAWTPLFVNAAGLILECGGTLSHGAVVAREMGLPAVVLAGATMLFADGEVVTVDGRHGAVSRSSQAAAPADAGAASPDDVHIGRHLTPPPPGRRERSSARLRNAFLLLWGVYFPAAFLLPEAWVYRPSFALLDWLLWPLVYALGKPATVAVVAAALAMLTMLGQRLLTDNRRLRQAKRRANQLTRQAARLPEGCPRRKALAGPAALVQARTLAAACVPLSALLGPMVMTFLWLPARVAPTAWNAAPGSDVNVVATIDGDFRAPVALAVPEPLRLDESSPAERTLPPIRQILEEVLVQYRDPPRRSPGATSRAWSPDLGAEPWELQAAAARSRQETLADLQAYLAAGVPAQGLTWKVRAPHEAAGSFPVTVQAGSARPVTLRIILGDLHPPAPAEAAGDAGSPIRSVRIVYPPSEQKRIFWAPLARLGLPGWDAGWLLTYLLAYLPAMFLLRWLLKIA